MFKKIIIPVLTWSSICLLGTQTGCQHIQQQLTEPRGDIRQQQYRAALFDPYALPEIGKDLGGQRPREFDRPLPEPVREKYLAELSRRNR